MMLEILEIITESLQDHFWMFTSVSCHESSILSIISFKKLLSIYYKKKITVKAPNDLLINKKKICGILQEIIKQSDKTYMILEPGVRR